MFLLLLERELGFVLPLLELFPWGHVNKSKSIDYHYTHTRATQFSPRSPLIPMLAEFQWLYSSCEILCCAWYMQFMNWGLKWSETSRVLYCVHMEVSVLFVFTYPDQAGSKTHPTLQNTATVSVHTRRAIDTLARVSGPLGICGIWKLHVYWLVQQHGQPHASSMPLSQTCSGSQRGSEHTWESYCVMEWGLAL